MRDDDGDDGTGTDRDLLFHVNGDLVPEGEATVPVRDRGFMYGDGVFETLRVYGGEPFEWRAHRERLDRGARRLGLADAVPADLRERVDETLAANDLRETYLKTAVTRGAQPGTLTPDPDVDPTVVVYVSPLGRGGVEGDPVWGDAGGRSGPSPGRPRRGRPRPRPARAGRRRRQPSGPRRGPG